MSASRRILLIDDELITYRHVQEACELSPHTFTWMRAVKEVHVQDGRLVGLGRDEHTEPFEVYLRDFPLVYLDGYLHTQSRPSFEVVEALVSSQCFCVAISSKPELNNRLLLGGAKLALLRKEVLGLATLGLASPGSFRSFHEQNAHEALVRQHNLLLRGK